MRKEFFEVGEYYHIYNRGVDHRVIFHGDKDRTRFIHGLYILNNFLNIPFRFNIYTLEPRELLTPIEPYVEIAAGCLMSNHFHLVLTPKRKDGVSELFHKLGISHTKYFNTKYERTGRLFESTFKARHVDRHEYAQYVTQYIHLNPLPLCQTKFGTKDLKSLFQCVCSYKWSSLPDYLGGKSAFSLVLSSNFQKEVLDLSPDECRNSTYELFNELCQT